MGEGRSKLRVERTMAFVDAVLAIALTILVLGIEVPKEADLSPAGISEFLRGLIGDLHPYVGSFAIIAALWIQHSVMSHFIRRGSRSFQWLNVLFLLPVSLIPFVTQLRAEYAGSPVVEGIAGVVLACSFVMLYALWRYATSHGLTLPSAEPAVLASVSRRILLGAALSAMGALLSIANPHVGSLVFVCAPLLFLRHSYADSNVPAVGPE